MADGDEAPPGDAPAPLEEGAPPPAAAEAELALLKKEEELAAQADAFEAERRAWGEEREGNEKKVRDAKLACDAFEKQALSAAGRVATERKKFEAAEAQHAKAVMALKDEIEKLKVVKAALEAREEMIKEKYAAALGSSEEQARGLQKAHAAIERQEAEHTSLLVTLTADIEALKKENASMTKDLEKAETAKGKDALLHKLFQEQIENTAFDLTQTKALLEESNAERAALADRSASLDGELRALKATLEDKSREYEAQIRAMGRDNAEGSTALMAEESKTKDLTFELDTLKEKYFEHVTENRRRETQNHRSETELKAEVKKLSEVNEALRRERDRDAMEASGQIKRLTEDTAALTATLEAVRKERREAEAAASKEQKALEVERDELQVKYAQVYGQVNASHHDTSQKIATLQRTVDRMEQELAAAVKANDDLQAVNAREVATLEARLDTAQKRNDELSQEVEQKEATHQDKALVTWHEREGLKRAAGEREAECNALREELANYKLQVGTELSLARRREHDIIVDNRGSVAALEAKAFKLEADLTVISGNYDAAIEGRRAAEGTLDECRSDHGQLVASLKAEIDGYQKTVKKLEGEVIANYDKKALAAQNEELKETVQMFRNKISSLEHTVSSIKIEADIIESRKTKALQESNTQCIGRILQLQEELDVQQELLCNIVPFTEATAFPPATLRSLQSFVHGHQDTELGKLLSSHKALALAIDGSRPEPGLLK